MAHETIRVGIVGAGRNTREKHIPGLQEQEGVELAAVANRTRASARKVAEEFGIPNVAESWADIIDDDTIDAVCIGTWPYMHAPLTIAALEAGKHVLCEARMAMNSQEAHEMLRESRLNPDCIAQIVPAPMTLPFDRTVVGLIADGAVGDLIALDARIAVGSDFPNFDAPAHWRHERDFSGNNIMSMGIWYECLMRWVGPAATVQAVGQSVVAHRLDEQGRRTAMTIPDHIDIIGRLEQGGQMRLNITSVAGHAPAGPEVYVFGTEGTLCLRPDAESGLTLYAGKRDDAGLEPIAIDPAKRGGWRVEEEFINAIRGIEPVTHTDFVTGVKYMEWTDAVTISLRQNCAVSLPLMHD